MTCNVDVGHPCDAGPDGEPCAACAEYMKESAAEAWRLWQVASPQERDPVKYEQDMREVGRGHLVRR